VTTLQKRLIEENGRLASEKAQLLSAKKLKTTHQVETNAVIEMKKSKTTHQAETNAVIEMKKLKTTHQVETNAMIEMCSKFNEMFPVTNEEEMEKLNDLSSKEWVNMVSK